MNNSEATYSRLQKHIDKQTVGFPATKSKAELRILRHMFTEEEAHVALVLTYKLESLDTLFNRIDGGVESAEKLGQLLESVQKKGGLESKEIDGKMHYCLVPLVVGMYELQVDRLSPEFLQDFKEYTKSLKFGVDLLATKVPQMRTIPVAKSIDVKHNVSTFDQVSTLLEQADGPFAILECICRKKKNLEGHECHTTERQETCLAIGDSADMVLRSDSGREISRDEALSILEKNQKEGLVLQPSNTQNVEFICSCCGCCCGMLGIHKKLPMPLKYWASNYYAVVDNNLCTGCGVCEKRCQVDAIHVLPDTKVAQVDLKRCLGCGSCIDSCKKDAITLVKKAKETQPPKTKEELYDIIMANKKGRLRKAGLMGEIAVDAIRTGQTKLIL